MGVIPSGMLCQSDPKPTENRPSPPDSGVVPFSEECVHQLRVPELLWPRRTVVRKDAIPFHRPHTSRGENDDNATCLRD